jgi:hypothetical protein
MGNSCRTRLLTEPAVKSTTKLAPNPFNIASSLCVPVAITRALTGQLGKKLADGTGCADNQNRVSGF